MIVLFFYKEVRKVIDSCDLAGFLTKRVRESFRPELLQIETGITTADTGDKFTEFLTLNIFFRYNPSEIFFYERNFEKNDFTELLKSKGEDLITLIDRKVYSTNSNEQSKNFITELRTRNKEIPFILNVIKEFITLFFVDKTEKYNIMIKCDYDESRGDKSFHLYITINFTVSK